MFLEPVAAPEFNQIKIKGLDNRRFRAALPMTRVSFNEETVEGDDLAKGVHHQRGGEFRTQGSRSDRWPRANRVRVFAISETIHQAHEIIRDTEGFKEETQIFRATKVRKS